MNVSYRKLKYQLRTNKSLLFMKISSKMIIYGYHLPQDFKTFFLLATSGKEAWKRTLIDPIFLFSVISFFSEPKNYRYFLNIPSIRQISCINSYFFPDAIQATMQNQGLFSKIPTKLGEPLTLNPVLPIKVFVFIFGCITFET